MNQRIIGIDPGSEESGMIVLDDSNITGAFILKNDYQLFDKVTNFSIHRNLVVVIEDIKPYSIRLTPQVIDTCKFIGKAVERLQTAGMNVQLISRWEVKKWVFDTFPEVCMELIDKKAEKKMWDACDLKTKEEIRVDNFGRKKRKPSFISIDDKLVTESMKYLYKIPLPVNGKGYEYGLKDDSWQALAVALCYKAKSA